MASDADQPDKVTVTEALVLAFSNSKVREIVGTDALRSVLNVEYHDIIESGAFDLQQVWELLEEQPDFDPEAAKPPMCLFKSWEEKLGIAIILPDTLQEASDKEVALQASHCRVGPTELQRLLHTTGRMRAPAPQTAQVREVAPEEKPRRQSRPVVAAAGVVAMVCFAFAGYHLFRNCGGPDWESMSVAEFRGELPIEDSARRLGAEVGVTLTDSSWLDNPTDDEKQLAEDQLKEALRRLEPRNVNALYIKDKKGRVRATAVFYGRPGEDGEIPIRVRFLIR